MSTKNLTILGNSYLIILMFLSACTNQVVKRTDLCDKSHSFWDTSPLDTIYFDDRTIITSTSYKFCKNDSVNIYVYLIKDSIRNNCCPPHTRKWTIKGNALIINNDTIFVEKYLKDTLFVRQMIFDTIRHYKLVRNRKFVKEEYIHLPDLFEM